uniref:Dynactin subunit 4 n=1 Tax=Hucho hucho TaxID=62062 RepID=A0A4W5LYY9_9TELE
MHTLSTRATNIPAPLPDDPSKTAMKKAYYLACGFCRWTSRDVGMADKSVASGGWQEPDNPHTQRVCCLPFGLIYFLSLKCCSHGESFS